jgi:hypothetical protein
MSYAHLLSIESSLTEYYVGEKERYEKKRVMNMSRQIVKKEIFKKGLYNLGKTANFVKHAYLNLDISHCDLHSIVVRK